MNFEKFPILGMLTQEMQLSNSDLDIFVSKYQLQLPDKAKLEAFINNELKNTK